MTTVYNSVPQPAARDKVLELAFKPQIDLHELEALCTTFEPVDAEDVLIAFTIHMTLQRYLGEVANWTFFLLLKSYDFSGPVRRFELDLAMLVQQRSQSMLKEISSWDIQALKQKVTSLPKYHSDAATVLTVQVLRIVSSYSELESHLLIALSRSTLVKIYVELSDMLGDAQDSGAESNPLLLAYRGFVKQLLAQMDDEPMDSARETFQIVEDLRLMFSKFSEGQSNRSLFDSPEHSVMGDSSPLPLHTHDDNFCWNKENFRDHNRSISMSSSFGNLSTTSAATSVTDELPSLMYAFDVAKQEQQHLITTSQNMHLKQSATDQLASAAQSSAVPAQQRSQVHPSFPRRSRFGGPSESRTLFPIAEKPSTQNLPQSQQTSAPLASKTIVAPATRQKVSSREASSIRPTTAPRPKQPLQPQKTEPSTSSTPSWMRQLLGSAEKQFVKNMGV